MPIQAEPPFRKPRSGFLVPNETNKRMAALSALCPGDASHSFCHRVDFSLYYTTFHATYVADDIFRKQQIHRFVALGCNGGSHVRSEATRRKGLSSKSRASMMSEITIPTLKTLSVPRG